MEAAAAGTDVGQHVACDVVGQPAPDIGPSSSSASEVQAAGDDRGILREAFAEIAGSGASLTEQKWLRARALDILVRGRLGLPEPPGREARIRAAVVAEHLDREVAGVASSGWQWARRNVATHVEHGCGPARLQQLLATPQAAQRAGKHSTQHYALESEYDAD